MDSLVEIVNKNPAGGRPVVILVQAIGDRERHQNGRHVVAANTSKLMLLSEDQCIRVEDSAQHTEGDVA